MNTQFNNMRCKINWHRFSDWAFVEDENCKETRTCSNCGHIQTKTPIKHDWGRIGFTREDYCEKIRRCKRCGEVKPDSRRIEHDWNKSKENVLNETCTTAIYCTRCHEEKIGSREITHSFKEIKFLSDDNCIMELQCTTCGKTENIEKHNDHMGNLYLIPHSCEATDLLWKM